MLPTWEPSFSLVCISSTLALRLHIFSVLFFSLPSFSSYADTHPGARCTVHAPCFTTTHSGLSSGSLMPAWGIICRIPRYPSSRVSFLSCPCVERHQSPQVIFKILFIYFLGCTGSLLEKAMAPHSSTLAWKIPWTEGPGGLQSMGSLGVGHD